MKYENYKIENLVFMNGTDGWSMDEKKEFLETCPENGGLQKTLEDLKALKTALEEEIVKCNKYGEINKNSLKAYLTRHDTNIMYGSPWRRYYASSDKDFYFNVDGSYQIISRGWQIEDFIEKYTDDGRISERFDTISRIYSEKENKWAKDIETNRYKATHGEQIAANKKLDLLLDSLDIIIPVGFQEGSFGRLECKKAQLRRGDYWLPCNEYGEILINKTPFTEDQANELTDTILEMSKKIAAIVDEYRGTIDQALGRKGA